MSSHKIGRQVKLDLLQRNGIVGVGEGMDDGEDVAVVTIEPWAEGVVDVPQHLDGLRVVVRIENEASPIGAQMRAQKYPLDTQTGRPRPVQPGVSIGPVRGPFESAGTVSFLLTDEDQVYVPSNNHVLADVDGKFGQADPVGEPVMQPSPFDGGGDGDVIGSVDGFVPVDPDNGHSTVDMAWTRLDGDVQADMRPVYMQMPTGVTDDIQVGDALVKVGRTTGVVEGYVTSTNESRSIRYSAGGEERSVVLEDQIVAEMANGGGDSGSPVVHAPTGAAVGIACASSEPDAVATESTIINKATNWEAESGMNIVTPQRRNRPSGLSPLMLGLGAVGVGVVWAGSK